MASQGNQNQNQYNPNMNQQHDFHEVFSLASLREKNSTNNRQKQTSASEKRTTPKETTKQKAHCKLPSKSEYQVIYEELQEIDPDEMIMWIGHSTQAVHWVAYTICFLFFWLLFPLVIAYYLYKDTNNLTYVITDQRLRVYSGVFVKRIDDVELFRVKDTIYIKPFILGQFGFSDIELLTSDPTWGDSKIKGVKNGRILREKIRKIVNAARDKKGVREIDYYSHGRGMPMQG
jgi:membrane protein YdbS with pleckstrin-like domain